MGQAMAKARENKGLSILDAAATAVRSTEVRSLTGLATKYGIPYARLRAWLERGRVPPRFLEIAEFLGLATTMSQLKTKFGVREAIERQSERTKALKPRESLNLSMRDFNSRLRQSFRAHAYEADLSALFDSMQNGDIMLVTTRDSVLYESTDHGLERFGASLKTAIGKGARLIYIRPSAEAVHLQDEQDHVRKHLEGGIRIEHAKIRATIAPSTKQAENVSLVLAETSPFWMPGVIVASFFDSHWKELNVYLRVAQGEVDHDVVIQMNDAFKSAFRRWAESCLRKSPEKAVQNIVSTLSSR